MTTVTTIGIDLAKNVFQLHGADSKGRDVFSKKVSRKKLLLFFANHQPCLVGMEACCGSHYFARELVKLGHEVCQMAPQHVKPYVKTNKSDRNDAQAIAEAVTRPSMRFVSIKNIEQQDIQALHRIRERLVRSRTGTVNQVRGLITEYGLVIPQGINNVRRLLPEIIEDLSNELTLMARDFVSDLYSELVDYDLKIEKYTKKIKVVAAKSELCRRLLKIPGFGELNATALVAAVGDAKEFKNGRHLAAWLGLVPRQHSSGGKDRLLGISKRGNTYLRTMLIHGGRSVLRHCPQKEDRRSIWLRELAERRGNARAAVAQANKMARQAWVVLARSEEYDQAA